jgi:hypothetical protein
MRTLLPRHAAGDTATRDLWTSLPGSPVTIGRKRTEITPYNTESKLSYNSITYYILLLGVVLPNLV